jgi:hypothetical protein
MYAAPGNQPGSSEHEERLEGRFESERAHADRREGVIDPYTQRRKGTSYKHVDNAPVRIVRHESGVLSTQEVWLC